MRLHKGDIVTVHNISGRWRIHHIERHSIWLTGIDYMPKLIASLSPCGIVAVKRSEVIPHPTQDMLPLAPEPMVG